MTINEKDYNKEMLTQLEMLYNLPNIPQMLSRRDKDALEWAIKLGDWYIKNKDLLLFAMKMTREEFKDIVLNILLNQKFGNIGVLFDTEDMSRYKIAQYDEEEWDVESSMPLGEFLDELYEDIK